MIEFAILATLMARTVKGTRQYGLALSDQLHSLGHSETFHFKEHSIFHVKPESTFRFLDGSTSVHEPYFCNIKTIKLNIVH